jgi:hypothetical protein
MWQALDSLRKGRVFSMLELREAYLWVELEPRIKGVIAFSIRRKGLSRGMPYDHMVTPATFKRFVV